ncbi:amino acid decarboxylase [Enterococcus sp. AZ109]|uniref:prenylated flavin chaperone LpdD n=1 Tax=Enterococcus sp. AZ109 TaxID=2774634 RepID=UPI003F21508F
MHQQQVYAQAADFTMSAEAKLIGADLLITLVGGDTHHIGTVTTWSNKQIETIRFESHSGRFHKDDVLAEKILDIISPCLSGNCVITSGVHVNGINKEQIDASFEMAADLGQQLAEWLKETPFTFEAPVYKKKG